MPEPYSDLRLARHAFLLIMFQSFMFLSFMFLSFMFLSFMFLSFMFLSFMFLSFIDIQRELPPHFCLRLYPCLFFFFFFRFNMDDQEHLFSNDSAPSRPGEEFDTSKVRFSGRLPGWLWGILAAVLGIDSGKR